MLLTSKHFFVKNKNISKLKTFQKKTLSLIKTLLVLQKSVDALDKLQDQWNIKINCGENYPEKMPINTMINLKTRFERKEVYKISEMWSI